jgi:hypothetical protein
MKLSPKKGKLLGNIKIGMLLVCVFTVAGLIVSNIFCLNLTGTASAGSDPINAIEPLKPFDHIILTWAGNPATTQAVTWRSLDDLENSVAEIAPARASPDFVKNARQISALTSSLKFNGRYNYYHSVNFTGLDADTVYAYRVGNGNIWSEWFQFRTAGNNTEPFSFLYFGDAQHKIFSLWSRTLRAAILNSPQTRFMIYAGDMVNRQNYDREWNEWFNAGGWVFATIPSIPAVGNHEYNKYRDKRRTLSKFWRPQFTLPQNGIAGLKETNYYLNYQGTRFVVLNSNEKIEPQARWLEKVLERNPNLWTVVVFHHPVYSSIRGRDNKEVRNHWEPLFEKFKVDLVLQGHDHVYSRGRSPGKADGPVYITSVSGPQMYNLARAGWMDRAGGNVQLFQVVSISPEVLNYKSVTVTGEIYDAFDLVKEDGQNSKLINRIPGEKAASTTR